MRRSFLTLAAATFGLFLAVGDASACCHKKKAACTPACAPAPVCAPAPAPVCEPVACAPKKKCFGGGMKLFGCHKKKAACAPVEVCGTAPAAYEYAAPAGYAAPAVYATGQASPSGQGF